jgi:tetratricopeptide (TPR) repeat protein
VVDELRAAGGPRQVDALVIALAEGSRLLEEDEAEKALPYALELKKRAPRSRRGRELLGLVYYRLGRYREAMAELRAYRRMSGDTGRDIVLADAERAVGNSESAERRLRNVLERPDNSEADRTEARIVLAAMAGDRGDLMAARQLLEAGPTSPKGLEEHHLRLWYALGDLAERQGDRARAADWFGKVDTASPGWGDAGERRRKTKGPAPRR